MPAILFFECGHFFQNKHSADQGNHPLEKKLVYKQSGLIIPFQFQKVSSTGMEQPVPSNMVMPPKATPSADMQVRAIRDQFDGLMPDVTWSL